MLLRELVQIGPEDCILAGIYQDEDKIVMCMITNYHHYLTVY